MTGSPWIALLAVLPATACGDLMPHVTAMSPDAVAIEYDPVVASVADAGPVADEACAEFGREAELLRREGLGTQRAFFRCVEPNQ